MEHRKVTCDQCEADLTYTSNCVAYKLHLAPKSIPVKGSVLGRAVFVTSMMDYPPIDNELDFCGVPCMLRYFKGDKRWAYFLSSDDDGRRKV